MVAHPCFAFSRRCVQLFAAPRQSPPNGAGITICERQQKRPRHQAALPAPGPTRPCQRPPGVWHDGTPPPQPRPRSAIQTADLVAWGPGAG